MPLPTVEVEHSLQECYDVSDGLLDALESNGVPVSLGVFALVLTMGRIMAGNDRVLSVEESQRFVKDVIDFGTAALAEGTPN